jgi:hypothetical protein
VVYVTQLEWIRGQRKSLAALAAADRLPVEQLGPDMIVGMHAFEARGGRRFRWTEPVVLLRLASADADYEVRFDTGNLRGNPLDYVICVCAGGRRLPRTMLASEGDGTLIIRVPASFAAAATSGIVVVCSPYYPVRRGLPNRRRLGMPLLSIACVPSGGATRRSSVAA